MKHTPKTNIELLLQTTLKDFAALAVVIAFLVALCFWLPELERILK